jgi:hypothetical protein
LPAHIPLCPAASHGSRPSSHETLGHTFCRASGEGRTAAHPTQHGMPQPFPTTGMHRMLPIPRLPTVNRCGSSARQTSCLFCGGLGCARGKTQGGRATHPRTHSSQTRKSNRTQRFYAKRSRSAPTCMPQLLH